MEPRKPWKSTKTSAAARLSADIRAITVVIRALGPLREPEMVAATGLSEDRVYRACRAQQKSGEWTRRFDGEFTITPQFEVVL